MRNPIAIIYLSAAVAVAGAVATGSGAAAMGSGGDPAPRSRVNPPSAADVDAAQGGGRRDDGAALELPVLSAADSAPDDFLWTARPVVVFADTPADPAFLMQMRDLEALPGPLTERDVVVVTDTDPEARSLWRQRLHPRGFSLVIIDKDGQVKQRKPRPWSVREITRAIDKFPLRREETGRAGMVP